MRMLDPQQSVENIPTLYINYEQIPYVHACKTRSPTVDMRVLGCLKLPTFSWAEAGPYCQCRAPSYPEAFLDCALCVYMSVCVGRCGSLDILKSTSKVVCDKSIN